MSYTFSYTISEEDYLEFSKFHHSNSRESQRRIFFSRLAIPAMLAIWVLLHINSPYSDTASTITISVISLIISLAWIFFTGKYLLVYSIRSGMKSMQKEGKLPYGRDVKLEVDDDGIRQYSEQSDTKVNYGAIEKIVQGPNAIYVYIGALQAFIIPHRVFENDAERADFLEKITYVVER